MKKLLLASILIIIALSVYAVHATFFVVLAGPPAWVDVNEVENSEVYALEFMQGQTVNIRDDSSPGMQVEWTVAQAATGFAYDVNDHNAFTATFTPEATGTFYIRVEARVILPYRGGLTEITYAFRVQAPLFHEPIVTFEVVD